MFQHTNIRTPRWLGYIVQRPESHSCHHERGVHARNYGDLPLFDMLFGTFHNPERFEGECGFHDGGSARVGAMLIGRVIA
jgi:sterol desaturase/sphingolipid hydroxylase (fatty acid hydroxylase superfamily)